MHPPLFDGWKVKYPLHFLGTTKIAHIQRDTDTIKKITEKGLKRESEDPVPHLSVSDPEYCFLTYQICISEACESSKLDEMVAVTSLYKSKLSKIKESMLRISERSASLRFDTVSTILVSQGPLNNLLKSGKCTLFKGLSIDNTHNPPPVPLDSTFKCTVLLQTTSGAAAGGQASRGAATRGAARSASPTGTPTHRQEQFRVRLGEARRAALHQRELQLIAKNSSESA
jgi:hypothetical protein